MPSRGAGCVATAGPLNIVTGFTFVMFSRVLQQFAAGGGLHRPAHRALLRTSEICCSTGRDAGMWQPGQLEALDTHNLTLQAGRAGSYSALVTRPPHSVPGEATQLFTFRRQRTGAPQKPWDFTQTDGRFHNRFVGSWGWRREGYHWDLVLTSQSAWLVLTIGGKAVAAGENMFCPAHRQTCSRAAMFNCAELLPTLWLIAETFPCIYLLTKVDVPFLQRNTIRTSLPKSVSFSFHIVALLLLHLVYLKIQKL